MKLVLINPRNPVSLYGDYLWQPLALGYVAAATPPHWSVELIDEQVEGALVQLRATPAADLLEVRLVGRAGLPSTVLGLLVHAAEHAQRHVGQLLVTARVVTNTRRS